jgi:flagellar protein FlaJ
MFSLKRRVDKKENKARTLASNPKEDKKAITTTVVEKKDKPKEKQIAKPEQQVSGIYAKSYKLLSKRIPYMFVRLSSMEDKIMKAGKPIPYQAYICGMVYMSMIGGLVGVGVGIVLAFLINLQPVEFRFFLPFFTGVAASQMVFGIMYILPGFSVGGRRKKFAEELPYFMGYMATLASSGLTLEEIFKAIAREPTREEIVLSARHIVRNIDILGMDIITAIRDLINRSPSQSFTELLEGLIATVETGGNLKEYFTATAKVQMEEKKLLLKKMTDALGIVSEMYTILLVVFPLMTIIMLSIMAIMQGNLMGMDITTMMKLVTYMLVPVFGLMILIMMDGMVPKR